MNKEHLIGLLKEARETLHDFAVNWDCESDAHKYNTTCRVCESTKKRNLIDAALTAQEVEEPVDSSKNVVESEVKWKRYDREQTAIFKGTWMNVWLDYDKTWSWRVGLLSGFKPTEAEAKAAAIAAVNERIK